MVCSGQTTGWGPKTLTHPYKSADKTDRSGSKAQRAWACVRTQSIFSLYSLQLNNRFLDKINKNIV